MVFSFDCSLTTGELDVGSCHKACLYFLSVTAFKGCSGRESAVPWMIQCSLVTVRGQFDVQPCFEIF